jgi:hypothetical protein
VVLFDTPTSLLNQDNAPYGHLTDQGPPLVVVTRQVGGACGQLALTRPGPTKADGSSSSSSSVGDIEDLGRKGAGAGAGAGPTQARKRAAAAADGPVGAAVRRRAAAAGATGHESEAVSQEEACPEPGEMAHHMKHTMSRVSLERRVVLLLGLGAVAVVALALVGNLEAIRRMVQAWVAGRDDL